MESDYRPVTNMSVKDVSDRNRAFWDNGGNPLDPNPPEHNKPSQQHHPQEGSRDETVSGEEGAIGTGAGAAQAAKPPEVQTQPRPAGYGPNTGFLRGGEVGDDSIEEEREEEDDTKDAKKKEAPKKITTGLGRPRLSSSFGKNIFKKKDAADFTSVNDASLADIQDANDAAYGNPQRARSGITHGTGKFASQQTVKRVTTHGGDAEDSSGASAWHPHSTHGENRKFDLHEGAGTQGGNWRTRERGSNNPEIKIHTSKKAALEHIHSSQDTEDSTSQQRMAKKNQLFAKRHPQTASHVPNPGNPSVRSGLARAIKGIRNKKDAADEEAEDAKKNIPQVGSKVTIHKQYGGGSGEVVSSTGSFHTVQKKKGGQEIHHESNFKKVGHPYDSSGALLEGEAEAPETKPHEEINDSTSQQREQAAHHKKIEARQQKIINARKSTHTMGGFGEKKRDDLTPREHAANIAVADPFQHSHSTSGRAQLQSAGKKLLQGKKLSSLERNMIKGASRKEHDARATGSGGGGHGSHHAGRQPRKEDVEDASTPQQRAVRKGSLISRASERDPDLSEGGIRRSEYKSILQGENMKEVKKRLIPYSERKKLMEEE